MVVLGPTKKGNFTKQGYDSRALNFDPTLSVVYPYRVPVNQSLISTISSENYQNGVLATPTIVGTLLPDAMNKNPTEQLALDSAAILTCLDKVPPADAFRPAYAGTDKTIYETKDIQWDLLPKLKPVDATPDWNKMARIYQRPWLDHIGDWVIQYSAPGQNQPGYGGIVTRMNANATLMLLLDVPKEQKEKLMIGFLQYGIDLHGLAECGRQWFSDGGHWMGRKWPVLFTSIMLNQPEIRSFPPVDLTRPVLYEKIQLEPGSAGPTPTTLFSEDMDTYYGKGADGRTILWQVVFHTHARIPYQERPYSTWNEGDKFINNYEWTGGNWPAFALAALYLHQKATWDHDAFFDYCDWFMQPGQQKIYSKDGHTGPARKQHREVRPPKCGTPIALELRLNPAARTISSGSGPTAMKRTVMRNSTEPRVTLCRTPSLNDLEAAIGKICEGKNLPPPRLRPIFSGGGSGSRSAGPIAGKRRQCDDHNPGKLSRGLGTSSWGGHEYMRLSPERRAKPNDLVWRDARFNTMRLWFHLKYLGSFSSR